MATTIVKTVKPSGGDYTSLAAAEAGEQRDLVAADEVAQIDCYAMNDGSPVTISGWTTDAAHYVHVNVPKPERHSGRWDTTKYYRSSASFSDNGNFDISQSYTRVEGVQVSATNSSTPCFHVSTGVVNATIIDCLAYQGAAIAFTADGGVTNLVFANCYALACDVGFQPHVGHFVNCIAIGCGVGFSHRPSDGSVWFYNCVAANGSGSGFVGDARFGARFTYCVNCYAGGNAAADFDNTNGFSSLTSCYSEDGSAGTPTVPFTTATFVNVTPGSEDLHLVAGSALIDAGTDLSADPDWLDPDGADDIEGTSRPQGSAWDVGAYEYVSAGGAIVPAAVTASSTVTAAVRRLRPVPGGTVNASSSVTASIRRLRPVAVASVSASSAVTASVRRLRPVAVATVAATSAVAATVTRSGQALINPAAIAATSLTNAALTFRRAVTPAAVNATSTVQAAVTGGVSAASAALLGEDLATLIALTTH